jgi:hypothetical protein
MHKLAIVAAAALTAATFGAAAMAQDSTTGDFGAADANKDALVSWDEALAVYPTLTQELFNQADANADGNLDEAEFTALIGLTAGLDGTSSSEAAPSSSEAPSSSAQ